MFYFIRNNFFCRNFKLLSFGEEAEEDEEETSIANTKFAGRSKSTHDLLNDPKLSMKTTVEKSESESEESEVDLEEQLKTIRNKLTGDKKKTTYYLNKDTKEERKRKAEEIKEEIKKVKKEYQENKLVKKVQEKEIIEEETKKSETFKEYKNEFDKYKEKKKDVPKKGKDREQFTLQLLRQFKTKMEAAREGDEGEQSNSKDDEDSDPDDTKWLAHKLRFQEDVPVLAKDANTKGDDWFEIYDPRNPINKRRRGEEGKKPGQQGSK